MGGKHQCLPPAKRFMLMQQEDQKENGSVSSSNLPAKKRKFPLETPSPFTDNNTVTTLCLPAKKRVWAFHPFDLNEEYTPFSFDHHHHEKIHDDVPADDLIDDDDGIICAICNSTDGDPLDPIVLCDGCDLMVHTTCYGHPLTKGVPEGDWFCSQCLASKVSDSKTSTLFTCCLCPETRGAMKSTVSEGKWAHIVCSLFVPEVFFVDSEGREGIDYSKVPKRRWETKCYICKSNNGCAIDCSEPKCRLSFHVTCGLKDELCIEYTEGTKNGVVAGFCSTHTELWKKQQKTGKFKIVSREEVEK
ncbi:unnamed protein product [Withania somnifera]